MISDPTIRGLVAGRAGAAFERDLDTVHDAYRRDGVASVDQLPVPTATMPQKWLSEVGREMSRGRARVLQSQQGYDYSGWFGRRGGTVEAPHRYAGLCIAMEAKANDAPKTSMPISTPEQERSGIQLHQLVALERAARDGVIACVVWRCGPPDPREPGGAETFRGVLLPPAIIEAVRMFESGERRSIPRAAFTPYEVVGFGFEDWLFPVRKWMELQGRACA